MGARSMWVLGVATLLAWAPVLAQNPREAERPPAPPAALAPAPNGAELLEKALAEAGVPDDVRGLFGIMAQDDLDPAMLFAIMAVAGEGNVDPGLMLFSTLMRGMGGQAGPPAAVVRGDELLVVDDGVLYKINAATMALEGQVTFRPKRDRAAALAKLVPLMAGIRAQGAQGPEAVLGPAQVDAIEQTCVSNLRQVAMAFLIYAKDHDQTLPGADWLGELKPYIHEVNLLQCPAEQGAFPAYGMNEKLLGMDLDAIGDPSRVVLLFEREPGDGPAIGGPGDLVARHKGNTVVAFADGHVQAIPIDQAMQQLKWDPE